MNPAESRQRTIVFGLVIVATTIIVLVGMLTHEISDGLIVALVSTPIGSILAFFTGRATAPIVNPPQDPPQGPPAPEPVAGPPAAPTRSATPFTVRTRTAVDRWRDRHRPATPGWA